MVELIEKIKKQEGFEVKENVSFKNLTTYKTGGVCRYLVFPKDTNSLISLLKNLKNSNIKYKIFGNGSNILASDNLYDGVIIKLSKLDELEINKTCVKVGAGYNLILLSSVCASNNLKGLEWASGIPGTVGGAVYMNAGAYLKSISDVLTEIKVLDENFNIKKMNVDELNYSYRKSNLMENKYIVLEATFKLEKGDKEEILNIMKDRKKRRMESQPLNYPSAGSVFRNPENDYAGRLVEECNLKGYSIGGAEISNIHANFVINKNNATSTDIKNLIELAKKSVYDKFNINLKVEQEFFNWE